MRIYNFEVSGKIKLEDSKGDDKPPNCGDNKLKRWLEIIALVVSILSFILGFLLPESDFLELLYRIHWRAIYSIIGLVIAMEAIYIVHGLIKRRNFSELIGHVLMSLLFFIILIANLWVYEKVVCPKLTTIEILYPKDGGEVSRPICEVKVFVRNVEWPIYPVVETPQGTQWIQAKRFIPHNQFKTILTQQVRLGEGYISVGETFKIFAIATKEDFPIGILERIPPDAIHSNTVTVRRVR